MGEPIQLGQRLADITKAHPELPLMNTADNDIKYDNVVQTITLAINAEGKLFWNNAPVTRDELSQRIAIASDKKPQPELQLRADKSTRYEVIAQVMAAAQGNGMTKLGFVTDPKDRK